MFRTRFSPADIAVLASLLLLAAALLFLPLLWQRSGTQLLITSPQGTQSYPLSVDRDIPVTSGGYTLTVHIRSGKVCVAESNCPDLVCVHSGEISASGQTLICAPAGIRLLITGKGGGNDADFVAG